MENYKYPPCSKTAHSLYCLCCPLVPHVKPNALHGFADTHELIIIDYYIRVCFVNEKVSVLETFF